MKIPPPLEVGDRVRLIAPSSAFHREEFEAGVALVRAAGFEAVWNDGIFARERYLAGDDERRASIVLEALSDPAAKAIWSVRGGYGATRIASRLREAFAQSPPKWIVGFSDVTVLHAFVTANGCASLYGANITTLPQWEKPWREELFSWLRGRKIRAEFRGRVHRGEGRVSGRLVGGNLTVLAALAGTGVLPSLEGRVLMLEDVAEPPYRLDRVFTQLREAGVLRGVVGIALGQFTRCDAGSSSECGAVDVIADSTALPVLSQLPFGHDDRARAAVLGAKATLDFGRATLSVALDPHDPEDLGPKR